MEVKCFNGDSEYSSKNNISKETVSTLGRLKSWIVVFVHLHPLNRLVSLLTWTYANTMGARRRPTLGGIPCIECTGNHGLKCLKWMKHIWMLFDFKEESYRVNWEQKIEFEPHKDPTATKCMWTATTSCGFQREAFRLISNQSPTNRQNKTGKKTFRGKKYLGTPLQTSVRQKEREWIRWNEIF